jgi:putative transposase
LSYRTYKFRLYPTRSQVEVLESHLAEACRLYNAALQERRDAWAISRHRISYFSQTSQLKDIRAAGDINIVNFQVAREVLQRVQRAFAGFFRRVRAGEKPGYPRFRSPRRFDSLTFQVAHGAALMPAGCHLHGIGEVKMKRHRSIDGTPKIVRIRRQAGRWFANVVTADVPNQPRTPVTIDVGIDVGLSSFAVLSDATVINNERHERVSARALRIAQRRVARRRLGSRGRWRAVRLLQRVHARIQSRRSDFHHKTSREIVETYQCIAVENLNIKGLARTRLARSIHDAGWGSFLEKLSYKAESAGRQFVAVNPRGTSQTCLCGARVPKTLATRQHKCPECGLSAPRDLVSAQLILRLGQSLWAPSFSRGEVCPQSRSDAELPQEAGR